MAHTTVTKAYSANTGAANTYSYSGSFDTFKATEVVVTLDAVALTYTASTINESASPREYSVDYTNKTVHIGGADLSSGTVVIKPVTDMGAPTARATYTAGSSITSADLNNNQTQLLRKAMEYDEQKLSSTGGTMTGDLTMGEDTKIIFEGATDDAYETTLTVTDPTADRTITIPNVSGTVVTTGDTATVTATMLAADSVDSSELVDGSIDTSHLGNLQVTTGKIAADAVTGAKIADDAIDSEHYVADSIDTEHYAPNSVDAAALAHTAVTAGSYTAADITVDAQGRITSASSGSIATAEIANNAVNGDKLADNIDIAGTLDVTGNAVFDSNVNIKGDNKSFTIELADGTDKFTVDSDNGNTVIAGTLEVTGAITGTASSAGNIKVAGNYSTNENVYIAFTESAPSNGANVQADLEIDTALKYNPSSDTLTVGTISPSNGTIAHNKLANVSDTHIFVGNGSNVPTAVAVSGDVTIANTGAVTIANDAVEIAMIGCEQTTISDSDSHIPTSGAVVDYVAAQIAPIGGLEVIADDESFPNTLPAAGVVISITDAAGLQINSSGVSTNGDTLDNSTVTINGFPSSLRGGVGSNADPYVLGSGAGLMVQSTGSSQTYNYHKALLKESDFVQLSDDINDFNSKYRIASSAPGSDNDEGDLYFNTSTNKMYVYDGSAWGEVTSTGDFKLLTIKDHDQASGGSGPTFNGSNEEFDLFDGSSDASITNAGQLIVSLNGVIQKPNSGTFSGSEEGFYLNDTHGIKFCDPPASGSTLFVTQIGTATTINTPGTGSISNANMFAAGVINAAAIGTGAVEHAKLAGDAVDGDNLADNACDSEHYTDGSIDHVHLANDCVDADNIDDNAVGLAAMAGIVRGKIIYGDASGNPAYLTVGGADEVLTSDGTDISWAAAAASDKIAEGNTNVECVDSGADGYVSVDIDGAEQVRFEDGGQGQIIVGDSGPGTTTTIDSETAMIQCNRRENGRGGILHGISWGGGGPRITLGKSGSSTVGTAGVCSNGDTLGNIIFAGDDGTDFARSVMLMGLVNAEPGNNDMAGEFRIYTSDDASHSPTVRYSVNCRGVHQMDCNSGGEEALTVNRVTADGTLIGLEQAGTQEGTIAVSGSTVSYNGGHLTRWSQIEGLSDTNKSARPTIHQGTVMSNLDTLCVWSHPATDAVLYTKQDADNGLMPDDKNVGDIKTPARDAYTEDNQQLNKTKVSSVEGDKDVAGVFWTWDDADDEYVNDYYVAMTGDMVIRVAGSTTVARGDLLISAGDGTAKPQADDIIRSSTIAKIISTNSTATYADGSKAYPCVLMAC